MAEEIKKNKQERSDRPQKNRKERPVKVDDGFDKRLVSVRRVSKTVKGGRTMHFSALVVIGDGKGNIGMGIGKAAEVPIAIDKATVVAKKNMKKVSLNENTIPHETIGKFGATSILMLPAEEGHGVIAGGAVRAVVEDAGIKDIRTKCQRTNNPCNVVTATMAGLRSLQSAEQVAAKRGKTVKEILG